MTPTKPVTLWLLRNRSPDPSTTTERCLAYAELQNMNVARALDLPVEGGWAARRPMADIVTEDLQAGRAEGVLSLSFNTLANGLEELSDFSRLVFEAGGWIVLADGSLDTRAGDSTFSVLLESLRRWSAASEQPRQGQPEPAFTPPRIRSPAPFGYRWMNAFPEPHPIEAVVCRNIFESYAELGDRKLVAARLNLMGYRARDRRRLSEKLIRSVILNPAAKGLFRGNRKPSGRDLPSTEAEVFIPVEPIVDEELWNRCNAILAASN